MFWSWWRYLHFLTSTAKCLPHLLRIFKNKGQNRYLKSLNEISLTFFYSVMRGFQYLIGEKSNSSWFLQKNSSFQSLLCARSIRFIWMKSWNSNAFFVIENEMTFMVNVYSVGITAIFNLQFRIPTKLFHYTDFAVEIKMVSYLHLANFVDNKCVRFIRESAKVVDVYFSKL